MNEQELIKLKADCEVYKNKIDVLEKVVTALQDKVIKLETKSEKTDFQYEQIMNTLTKLTDTTIPNLSKEIQSLKEKPAKRYDNMVSTVINTIIGAIVGFIAAKIFNK